MSHYDRTFTIRDGVEACTFADIDPETLAVQVHEVFTSAGYRVIGEEGSASIYEYGSKLKRVLLGAMVRYFKIAVSLHLDANGEVVVRLQNRLGDSGGSVAKKRIKREHQRLVTLLQAL
ncbi:MAG: hypothetical protein LBD30_00410 [Verrucomicrobiales bacterium]|jgi:hypothetical protein|nr:hypothetical protein [Verrucomicrobiales bacterium]